MTDKKIIEVTRRLEAAINQFERYIPRTKDADKTHMLEMCRKIPQFLEEGRREKANRWIGYIQGAMVAHQVLTLSQCKDMNQPT
jgi:hypothetical protein